jgi:Archaeal Type IV pilin, N-terminal
MQYLKNSVHHESAVSEAIGAILLVSIVVLAVAIIGVALTSQSAPQKLPAVSAVISSSGSQVSLYHDGGDTLASSELSILVNGNPVPFTKSGNPAPWTWSTGDTLSYTMSSGTPQTVRIVYIPGSYTIASADFTYGGSGAIPTPSTLSTFIPTPTPTTAPTVTGITPSGGNADTTVSITSIAGTNFASGATVKLTRSGYADIALSGITVSSPLQITGGNVNLAGAAAGQWNVVVTNPDLQSGSLSNGFTVTNTAPAVSSIAPSAGTRGTMIRITNLAGSGFLSGATVRLNRTDSTAIPASNVVVVSATQITCDIALPSGATVGMWDIVVTNPDTQEGALINGFAVQAAAPVITAISPNSSLQTTPVSVSVAGTGFQPGANLTLKRAGYSDILATGVVFGSSNMITGNFNLMTATPGPWDVVVTNTDGQSGTLAGGFTVRNPTPSVTSITPNTGIRGWTVSITNLAGTNFRSGAVVKLVNASAGPDIVATNVVVVSATRITCTFDLTGANAARRNVTVTNPSSDTGVGQNLFTVTSNAPTLTARNPTSGNRGWPVTILSLTGTGFQPGATVLLRRSGYSDVVATGVNVASPTSINAGTLNLLGVTAGTWYYVVINTDGQASTSTSRTFTVNSLTPTIPGTPAFSPSGGGRGTTGLTITAPGTYLQPGMAVVLTGGSTTITAYNVNVASPASVTFTIDIPAGASTGWYTARYTNTDGRTVSRTNRFQVT